MILDFNQIKKDDVIMAGGKGANLGELVSIGVNVPTGFVITTDVYKNFIRENGIDEIIAKKLAAAGNDDMLLDAAKQFRQLIKSGEFNAQIKTLIERHYAKLGANVSAAVRSSATAEDLPAASFAGQQETYLNVRGIDDICAQIRNCYASLWSDRAVVYRANQSYEQDNLAIAVVVQTMVESEKAGVIFTVNPVSKKRDEVLINANYGLGESVVSGRVTADAYVVAKSGEIIDIGIGNKEIQIVYDNTQTKEVAVSSEKQKRRVLSDEEITALLRVSLKIEAHYDHPVDIEWAIKNRQVFILQARTITTIEKNSARLNRPIPDYVNNVKIKKHNRELMSFLIEKIPFTFKALEYDYFTAISEQKLTILEENGITVSKNIVMDADGLMSIRREKVKLNRNIVNVFSFIKSIRDYDNCAKQCRQFLSEYRWTTSQYKALDFEQMSLAECRAFLDGSYQLTKAISYNRFRFAVAPSMLEKRLTKAVKKVNKHYTSFDLYRGMPNKTSQIGREMLKLATAIKQNNALKEAILNGLSYRKLCQKFSEFKRLTDIFLSEHGYTVDYVSYCVDGKSFLENPDRIIKLLTPLISRDDVVTEKNSDKAFAELANALKDIYGKKYPQLAKRIKNFRYFHYVREEGHYLYEVINFYLRQCLKRINILLIGDENYQQGVANLFHHELIEALNRGRLIDDDLQKIAIRNDNLPFAQSVWDAFKLTLYNDRGETLTGLSGNKGIAVGRACTLNSPDQFYKMKKGDVLVCPFTAPEWTSLFKLASAVVADTGSSLSHAAIVAREYGIPAVLGVGYATATFKDGDMIKVDGDNAKVTRV